MKYLLDTNIFIRSKNDMPFDIYLSFWNKIAQLAQSGSFYSSVKVEEEILKGNDGLTDWIRANLPNDFFLPVDGLVLAEYAKVQIWASDNPIFTPSARNVFANVADAFLVATASARKMTLVTFEKSNPLCAKRVLIPDACLGIGVNCCDLNTAFKALNVTF
ncbi:MAG: DUF4411 family protein [Prevotellaceae bacterium]|jgi:predicted nucleic acid-binding protein|nr:DUF4411 family protein [Prevotellaceae bacterium]